MALILEQLDARRAHVVRRISLDATALTFGRALDSSVVLDDPHADAAHARLVRAENGTFVLEDAGSVNGIDVLHSGRTTRLALAAGVEFRLGRTLFRVADTSAPLPAALSLSVEPSGALPWYERRRIQLVTPLLMVAFAGVLGYLGTSTRDGGSTALGLILGLIAVVATWAGVWALVGRTLVRRPAFAAHATLAAATLLTFFVSTWIIEWAGFVLPAQTRVWSALDTLVGIGAMLLVTFWQLGLATAMPARRRWVGALGACGVIAVLVGAFALVEDDPFSDVPEFEGTIRYAPAALIPATGVDGFRTAITELRADVDSLKPRTAATRER